MAQLDEIEKVWHDLGHKLSCLTSSAVQNLAQFSPRHLATEELADSPDMRSTINLSPSRKVLTSQTRLGTTSPPPK